MDELNNNANWLITEDTFTPDKLHHRETIFTIGNGYLGTRGAFEERYPGEMRATFLHGVFDDIPILVTELANAPDWLDLEIILDGEKFSLDQGEILSFHRSLDLRTATLRRDLRWRSPKGKVTLLTFERFASLTEVHLCGIKATITPENDTTRVEIHSGINSESDNLGYKHWNWQAQGMRENEAWLFCLTRTTRIGLCMATNLDMQVGGQSARIQRWNIHDRPTLVTFANLQSGQSAVVTKWSSFYTTREVKNPTRYARKVIQLLGSDNWDSLWMQHRQAWEAEWERCEVTIDGDDEAQLAIRFNIYQLLIAAPRNDECVNIGAKTLSGFGYRGHSFWDTEVFMLPFFIYTSPHIARNLLNYRWHNLPGARAKARKNGFEGAQFPWESASDGVEVTPTYVPHSSDRTQLVRIWTGDIEIHISADIAFAAYKYWQMTGDDTWFSERGAELVLDTAKFWGSRAEWNAQGDYYEYRDVIGPDEYHEHVDNNAYTNIMAKWNLKSALEVLDWLKGNAPEQALRLREKLDLNPERLAHWRDVIDKIYIHTLPDGVIEQFEGYFQREYVDLAAMEPRVESVQSIFGIKGCNQTQVLKQPDVLMLQYLLPERYSPETITANYNFYTPRTDHTFGSSLGPSIQSIMACKVGLVDEAYEHFIRTVRADLHDVRGNARDGVHGASAGGSWQAVVFGFGGLQVGEDGWQVDPKLPAHWKYLQFQFFYKGEQHSVILENKQPVTSSS